MRHRARLGDASGTVPLNGNNFLSDVSDVADQTETVRGRIERVEMSLKAGFHMIATSDRFHMSPTNRGHVADVSQ